jgi:hypothetical protein
MRFILFFLCICFLSCSFSVAIQPMYLPVVTAKHFEPYNVVSGRTVTLPDGQVIAESPTVRQESYLISTTTMLYRLNVLTGHVDTYIVSKEVFNAYALNDVFYGDWTSGLHNIVLNLASSEFVLVKNARK